MKRPTKIFEGHGTIRCLPRIWYVAQKWSSAHDNDIVILRHVGLMERSGCKPLFSSPEIESVMMFIAVAEQLTFRNIKGNIAHKLLDE